MADKFKLTLIPNAVQKEILDGALSARIQDARDEVQDSMDGYGWRGATQIYLKRIDPIELDNQCEKLVDAGYLIKYSGLFGVYYYQITDLGRIASVINLTGTDREGNQRVLLTLIHETARIKDSVMLTQSVADWFDSTYQLIQKNLVTARKIVSDQPTFEYLISPTGEKFLEQHDFKQMKPISETGFGRPAQQMNGSGNRPRTSQAIVATTANAAGTILIDPTDDGKWSVSASLSVVGHSGQHHPNKSAAISDALKMLKTNIESVIHDLDQQAAFLP